ncbi:MAG TPA: MarR family transcriptional regulator [Gaiellaceae bacterium]|nr:MarR family transcriptional regulator [Gaiellaceae bacterium]
MSRQVLRPQAIELDAFARLARAHAVLRRELQAEVLAPRGLTMSDFDALLHISRAEGLRLRRVDLVERMMLTPSGVTRLLEGLEEGGLVESVRCEQDARATWAQLTGDGVQTLECVGATYAKRLRELFAGRLDPDEVEQLSELLGKLPGVAGGSCASA